MCFFLVGSPCFPLTLISRSCRVPRVYLAFPSRLFCGFPLRYISRFPLVPSRSHLPISRSIRIHTLLRDRRKITCLNKQQSNNLTVLTTNTWIFQLVFEQWLKILEFQTCFCRYRTQNTWQKWEKNKWLNKLNRTRFSLLLDWSNHKQSHNHSHGGNRPTAVTTHGESLWV